MPIFDIYYVNLCLFVANVLFVSGIELEVADRSNEGVNTKSEECEPEVSTGSAGIAFGLKTGVIDNDATNPTKEESE